MLGRTSKLPALNTTQHRRVVGTGRLTRFQPQLQYQSYHHHHHSLSLPLTSSLAPNTTHTSTLSRAHRSPAAIRPYPWRSSARGWSSRAADRMEDVDMKEKEQQRRRFEEEFGKKPLFMRKVDQHAMRGALLLLLVALFPLVLLPYLFSILDQQRLDEGLDALKEHEEEHGEMETDAGHGHGAGDGSYDGGDGGEPSGGATLTAASLQDSPDEVSPAPHYKYILIGAGTSSFHALKAIRDKDPEAQVLIIGDEPVPPYRRPPLTKDLWRTDDPDVAHHLQFRSPSGKEVSIFYQPEEWYAQDPNITFLKDTAVTDLNVPRKEVILRDGRSFAYSKCLIATGGTPIQIPGVTPDIADRISTFRTVADFRRLDSVTRQPGGKIAVVGGSFLGTELTAAIAERAHRAAEVVQIFPEPGVMARNLPRYLSEFVTGMLKERGVNILNDSVVEHVSRNADGRVTVHLDNGDEEVVDQVVLAIGISPNTELAEKAGLEIDPRYGGVVTNAELEARRGIYVAGDVASYHDTVLGRRRIEHHDHSTSSGRRAGLNMSSGDPRPYSHMPMFWSDVGDIGYEAVGRIDSSLDTVSFWDTVSVTQAGSLWSFAAAPLRIGGYHKGVVYYLHDNRVVGVLLWNLHGKVGAARELIKTKQGLNDPKTDLRNKIIFD
eukprot:gb/GECH01006486.1/.p1 GENE.gb/GECH01006486.1/~~gb/GECH01006486.1/.p1  ORF type:complete len:662 (+),score=132.90 gb/GECH01006486.1/:1-1986(+)